MASRVITVLMDGFEIPGDRGTVVAVCDYKTGMSDYMSPARIDELRNAAVGPAVRKPCFKVIYIPFLGPNR